MKSVEMMVKLATRAQIPVLEAKIIVNEFARTVGAELAKGNSVSIAGLGMFSVQDYAMDDKVETMIRFRTAKEIKEVVANGYPTRKANAEKAKAIAISAPAGL